MRADDVGRRSSPAMSRIMSGHPFVGPAGRLLDRCLVEAGIERGQTYVTNTVKHFKWVPRGTRRIHSKPNSVEIAACFPWLEAELAAVKPKILVALGATAAQALFGKAFRVTRDRGRPVPSRWAPARWRRCIRHRCCAPPTKRPAIARSPGSSRI